MEQWEACRCDGGSDAQGLRGDLRGSPIDKAEGDAAVDVAGTR